MHACQSLGTVDTCPTYDVDLAIFAEIASESRAKKAVSTAGSCCQAPVRGVAMIEDSQVPDEDSQIWPEFTCEDVHGDSQAMRVLRGLEVQSCVDLHLSEGPQASQKDVAQVRMEVLGADLEASQVPHQGSQVSKVVLGAEGSEVGKEVLETSPGPIEVLVAEGSQVPQEVLEGSQVPQVGAEVSEVPQKVLEGSQVPQEVRGAEGSEVPQKVLQGTQVPQQEELGAEGSEVPKEVLQGSQVPQEELGAEGSEVPKEVLQGSQVSEEVPGAGKSHVPQEVQAESNQFSHEAHVAVDPEGPKILTEVLPTKGSQVPEEVPGAEASKVPLKLPQALEAS